jgi:hypothetical protein
MGNITNGHPNHQWHEHIGIVKDAQLYDVVYQYEYEVL